MYQALDYDMLGDCKDQQVMVPAQQIIVVILFESYNTEGYSDS